MPCFCVFYAIFDVKISFLPFYIHPTHISRSHTTGIKNENKYWGTQIEVFNSVNISIASCSVCPILSVSVFFPRTR